jgi:hypothetical protein
MKDTAQYIYNEDKLTLREQNIKIGDAESSGGRERLAQTPISACR